MGKIAHLINVSILYLTVLTFDNRFQLRAYLKSTGPFEDVSFQDNDLSNPHFTGMLNKKIVTKTRTYLLTYFQKTY